MKKVPGNLPLTQEEILQIIKRNILLEEEKTDWVEEKLQLTKANKSLTEEKIRLEEEVNRLRAKLFKKNSEKYKTDQQLFDEAKATKEERKRDKAISVANKGLAKNTNKIDVQEERESKKTGGRKPIPEDYSRVDIVHDLKEEEKHCDCGCLLTRFGEEVSEQLGIIPAQIYVLRHKRQKYACKQCQENVKIAPVQNQAIAKCLAAPGLLAHAAILKFDDHLPLYRQSEIWKRLGVDISRSTLSSWILKIGDAVEPLIRSMQNHLVASDYIKADETTGQVLKTSGKSPQSNSYMWLYMTGNSLTPCAVYDYQQTRQGAHAKNFLKDFKGVLQTDGYSGYRNITESEGVIAQGCLAHARRKFYDAWEVIKKEGAASKALDVIKKLYEIEAEIKDLTATKRYVVRQEKSKPLLDAFHTWLLDVKQNVQSKTLLDKAVQYTLNQWEALTYYIKDGKVDIDNNAAETANSTLCDRTEKLAVYGSPDGAKAAANIYSLIESAKLNKINPEAYLKFILEHKIDGTDPILIQKLMPWNPELKDLPDLNYHINDPVLENDKNEEI